LSIEAFAQFQTLQDFLINLPDSSDPDSWEVFGSISNFKVSKAYKHFVGEHLVLSCDQKTLENVLSF
jgi:hypothetical protein